MYSSDKYFLDFILHGNKKQSIATLKNINSSQINTLKKIAIDLLEGHIPLSSNQIKVLKKSAHFIRTLAWKRTIHKNILVKNYNIVKKLLKIKFDYAESCSKVSTCSLGRMGKNKRQKYERNETSSSEFTSSGESEYFSNESDSEKYSEWKGDYQSDSESNDEEQFQHQSNVERFKTSEET